MNKAVIDFLKTKSISVIEYENIDAKMKVWKQWYRGKVDGFHHYKVYQGKKSLYRDRLSLNMPARVCQDWADLLLNEKVEVNCDDKNTQKAVDRLLKQVNFYVRGNNLIETSFAIGGGFFIQYWDGAKTNQKYITQEYCCPITYDSGRLTESAFASSKTIDGKNYTYIETHTLDPNGFYVIDNFICKETKNGLAEMNSEFYEKHKLLQKIETKSKIPSFQQIRPNIANRDVFDSPYGTSVLSGATDCFKAADLCFDAYYKEILLGKKRIFVKDDVSAFNINDKGEQVRVFDPNDEVFYSVPEYENEKPIVESNMDLRIQELDAALQTQLNLISQNCGFGANGYKWENASVSTATQIISENSKMFRTLKKHELLLNDAIINMTKSLLYYEKEFGNDNSINLDTEITVNFDDSIIEDTSEIKRQALTDFNVGLISQSEYFRQVYKLNDKQAKAFAKQMAQEKIEEADMQKVETEPPLEE